MMPTNNTATFIHEPISKGFTLIEVMIALALFSLAAIVFLGSQTTAIKLSQNSENMTMAPFLAEKVISEQILDIRKRLKNSDFKSLPKNGNGNFNDYPDYRWEFSLNELDFVIPSALFNSQALPTDSDDQSGSPEETLQYLNILKRNINENFKNNIKELTVKIFWRMPTIIKGQKTDADASFSLSTFIVNNRLDFKVEL